MEINYFMKLFAEIDFLRYLRILRIILFSISKLHLKNYLFINFILILQFLYSYKNHLPTYLHDFDKVIPSWNLISGLSLKLYTLAFTSIRYPALEN